jgi:DNA-binding winged helix-turn-helix (wHTH) protein
MVQPEDYAFGPFVYNPSSGRLSKHGCPIKLQRKSAALLECLLERSGQLVPTIELGRRLWPEGTHVEFDLGIRVALKKLRDALCDLPNEPTYIQTIRGEGFRFIAPVTVTDKHFRTTTPLAELAVAASVEPGWMSHRWLIGTAAVVLVVIGVVSSVHPD